MLFLTSDNEFSEITYSLFGGRQNIFLTIFSNKFVIKCAAKHFTESGKSLIWHKKKRVSSTVRWGTPE